MCKCEKHHLVGVLIYFFSLRLKNINFLKQVSRGPLHKAAASGQYEMVKMLHESGEDVDQRDQV